MRQHVSKFRGRVSSRKQLRGTRTFSWLSAIAVYSIERPGGGIVEGRRPGCRSRDPSCGRRRFRRGRSPLSKTFENAPGQGKILGTLEKFGFHARAPLDETHGFESLSTAVRQSSSPLGRRLPGAPPQSAANAGSLVGGTRKCPKRGSWPGGPVQLPALWPAVRFAPR